MKQVDELIRGELSAIQSIDAVLKNISDRNEQQRLNLIRQDHQKAVSILNRYAGSDVKADANTTTSGPWGAFTSAFAGGASFFGDKAALTALQVGEQHGINEYKEALDSDAVNLELKEAIRSELIPQQEQHLSMIKSFLQ